MPANIEIKAILKDRHAVETIAKQLSNTPQEVIDQKDVFFRCEDARLKLRIFGDEAGQLIRYERSNIAKTRISHYVITETSTPLALLDILTKTLGQFGTVKKTRTLYLIGQTRVHLDQVEGLGDFLELEVVLKKGQREDEGKQIADTLLAKFGIDKKDFLAEAYIDLLVRKNSDHIAVL